MYISYIIVLNIHIFQKFRVFVIQASIIGTIYYFSIYNEGCFGKFVVKIQKPILT